MKKFTVLLVILAFFSALAACDSTNDPDTSKNKRVEAENETSSNTTDAPKNDNASAQGLVWPEETLHKQAENDAVKKLQQTLIELGYQLDANGTYDQVTTNAITDIQMQLEDLMVLGVYNQETREALEVMDNHTLKETISPGKMLSINETDPVSGTDSDGTPVIANPYDQLALINKSHALPEDYQPEDLTVPDVRFPIDEFHEKKQLRQVAADALETLFAKAEKDGYHLFAQSGYRSYDTQVSLFNNYAEQNGEEAANTYSARPGESEHQSGLTMDITSESMSFELSTDFGSTPEGEWVKQHAADAGFIIRYPKGKEDITKYQYEPWHLRYVGKQAAQKIESSDLVLEEYFDME